MKCSQLISVVCHAARLNSVPIVASIDPPICAVCSRREQHDAQSKTREEVLFPQA
jgi:hypothetical protein